MERGAIPALFDHLATESLDNAVSAEARKAGERFTQQHISRWKPKFVADLIVVAKLDAYRMLGEVMENVLAEDCRGK